MQPKQPDFAAYAKATRNYQTLRNAMRCGINVGHFGIMFKNECRMFGWRLRGDTIEVRPPDSKIGWRLLDNNEYDVEFDYGVYGAQVDWSVPKKFASQIDISK